MARPIWKGSISFGLVNIPVQLETAVREKSVNFHMLSKDGSCRVRRKLVCPESGEEVPYNETARGIEVGKDEYVLVDEKELNKLKPEKGRAIEIEQFVDLEEIDPIYFDRVYYITPIEGGAKSYRLLHEAMKDSGRIALANVVMRDKQYLCALRVLDDGIVLHTMHYADEVLDLADTLPGTLAKAKTPAKEVAIARQLIDAMTHKLDLKQFHDEYRQRVEAYIAARKAGRKTVATYDDKDETPHRTINLMDALKRSLASNKSPRTTSALKGRHPRRKSA